MKAINILKPCCLSVALFTSMSLSAQSPGRVAATIGGMPNPPPSTMVRSTPSIGSHYHVSSSGYANSLPTSGPSHGFNSMANKGHINTLSPSLQQGMRNGNLVAAVPQKVHTPFIPGNTGKKINSATPNPAPRTLTDMTAKQRVIENRQWGKTFENRVKQSPGNGNSLAYSQKQYTAAGNTIPDFKDPKSIAGKSPMIEAKGTNRINRSAQIKRQQSAADAQGVPHVVIAAPHSKVSKPLQNSNSTILYLIK